MSLRFVSAQLDVRTVDSAASYFVEFAAGLNVIEAPNSWGKSTLVQSLVYGLGLEGSFSTSHLPPLGEAMTSSIELDGRRQAVVESSVMLIVQNDRGFYLRVKRWAKSANHDVHLVQTWQAGTQEELDYASRIDRYVRQPGSARRELGFHARLAEFIGWTLPEVPTFNSSEVPLYLEVLFPMFYVEQKYGWTGFAPRIPSHFRIQSAYRRAAEFVLGLGELDRIKEIERLRQSLTQRTSQRDAVQSSLNDVLRRNGWVIAGRIPPADPDEARLDAVSLDDLLLIDTDGGDRRTVAAHIDAEAVRLASMQEFAVEAAGAHTRAANSELRKAETEVASLGLQIRHFDELLTVTTSERQMLESRFVELDADKNRLADIRKLAQLGSDLFVTSFADAHCPTCAQSLDASHVATGIVLDIDANSELVSSERATVERLLDACREREEAVRAQIERERLRVRDARSTVRALRDELVGPSGAPSLQQVRERVLLENALSQMEQAFEQAIHAMEQISHLEAQIGVVERNLRILRRTDAADEDLKIVRAFSRRFQDALRTFGFKSLPVDEVTISQSTLLPEHDGFELTFDIVHGLSASDTVRMKWAYYVAISQSAAGVPGGNLLGTLIMDEPRQQEAARESVVALYRELAEVGNSQQVIVASSADSKDLSLALEGLDVQRIRTADLHILTAN